MIDGYEGVGGILYVVEQDEGIVRASAGLYLQCMVLVFQCSVGIHENVVLDRGCIRLRGMGVVAHGDTVDEKCEVREDGDLGQWRMVHNDVVDIHCGPDEVDGDDSNLLTAVVG